MNRIWTLIGVVVAVLSMVFQLASIAPAAIDILQGAAIVAVGIGVMTGQ